LQHLSYSAQVREKANILRDALIRIGGFSSPPPVKTVPAPEYGYRNRVRFHRVPGTKRPGFMARRSGKIIPVKDCPAADSGIRQALSRGDIAAPSGKSCFTVYSRNGLFLTEGKDSSGTTLLLDREITLDAGAFFQGSAAALETLIPDLLALAENADPSLPAADIYCGVGTFAAFLKDRFPNIDMVESCAAAMDLARKNVPGPLMRYFLLTDEEWVRETRRTPPSYGFAVIDPPRRGLSPSLRQWLAEEGPPLLAYISCDPAALARDGAFLRAGGFRLESAAFYDFYPQTAHIEALAVFARGENNDAF
jgi:23S rRNA (uracil1939-C5)-methyltransferase